MTTMDGIIININVPTKELCLGTLQAVLQNVRANRSSQNEVDWSKVLQLLWSHLETGLQKFDDQLLCATCFFTVLEYTEEKNSYLTKLAELVDEELLSRDEQNSDILGKSNSHTVNERHRSRTLQVVSLMYGMLQSTFVTGVAKDTEKLSDTLKSILDLLIAMGYEYSRYTFIVFKTMNSMKKVCDTELQNVVYNSSNLIKLLNLVNHNWENPITGVRDLNKSIFQTLVSLLNENLSKAILEEINDFYWNKAKFLMLSEIIDRSKERVATFVLENSWVDGLIYSLSKPGLVSAGADMYYAIVKNLNTENEWCRLFLDQTIDVLIGKSTKSIENFCNYWCLATFKKFPDVVGILIDELQKQEDSESKLYSSLCILKQAHKLGIMGNTWDLNTGDEKVQMMVLDGIEHCHSHIRMLPFEILCVNQRKVLPTANEFNLILTYLQNNVNSDCTVLRISMLGNVKCFLLQIHASFSSHTKNDQNFESQSLLTFYRSIQEFIIESLNLEGNYQRKITTLKLCTILLSSLNEVPKKRQKQSTNSGVAMTRFLKQNECLILFEESVLLKLFSLLKDPADDIRESTVQLLLDHYSKEITPALLNNLTIEAEDCIESKFFYQISCGQGIFRLISSLLLKEKYTGTVFKTVDDVFEFAYDVLNDEYEIKRDIVNSIEDGKQQHAYISILLEVLKVTKQNPYDLKDLKTRIPHLLTILEDISNQFAWEQEPATSSDFSKMSDMVQSIISSSGYDPLDEKDRTKISGLQQIVLNCLWLNVKASCDLASYLTQFLKDDEDVTSCRKCLTIITHVLETSRHKGAIEAAGSALGRAIQHLTSLPEESELSTLPLTLLKCKLNELILYTNMASVTRRGAGLSIMVHRIVSSDTKKGKPLFHHLMGALLVACARAAPSPAEGRRDEPRALYIHFLTRVVTDSGLASDLMFYSADLASLAFDNLTSPRWQIRNAALQLYGALIPKLIGQKKASGSDDETVATVACDEFRTHSPKLWTHMQRCLRDLDKADTINSHSNVMPILNVLANLARRYNFSTDNPQENTETELLASLFSLLDSPIFTVRRLTAKCIFNIFHFDTVYKIILKCGDFPENFIHGCLLLVGNYKKYSVGLDSEKLIQLQEKFHILLEQGNHSYISKREFDELYSHKYIKDEAKYIIQEAKLNRYSPGVFHWANCKLKRHVELCPSVDTPSILKIFLEENDYENYCELIRNYVETNCSISKPVLLEIGDILSMSNNKTDSCVIWKILYHISTHTDLSNSIDITSMFKQLESIGLSYKMRYMLPFLASLAAELSEKQLLTLSSLIFSLCDPDTSDVDMRYIASLANNEIAKAFRKISDSVRISAIKTAVLLLQDEDEDVRMMNIQFYSNLQKDQVLLHPYVCWSKILEYSYLQTLLDNPHTGVSIIFKELTEVVTTYAKSNEVDEFNPFSNDSKNIYFEPAVVIKQLEKLKENLN